MPDATIGVRIRSEGAEDLKARLQELREEFERGDISTEEYSKGLRGVNRDARALSQQSQIQTNVWRAQHPVLNSLSRSMSAFGSISHTALTAITAFSTLKTAFSGTNATLLDLQGQLAEAERNARKFKKAGDDIDAKEWEDKANVIRAQIKETNDQMSEQKITNIIGIGATIGAIAGNMGNVIKAKDDFKNVFSQIGKALGNRNDTNTPTGSIFNFGNTVGTSASATDKFSKALPKIIGAAAGVGLALDGISRSGKDFTESLVGKFETIGGMALAGASIGGPFGAVAGGAVGAVIALIQTLQEAKRINDSFQNSPPLASRFEGSARTSSAEIAAALGPGASYSSSNPAIQGPPTPTTSVSTLPPGAVRLGPRAIRLPGGQIMAGAHGLDTMVGGPTMFLAGEAGRQERVRIGNSSGGSGGGQVVVIVQGSIWQTGALVDTIDRELVKRLKRNGFVA